MIRRWAHTGRNCESVNASRTIRMRPCFHNQTQPAGSCSTTRRPCSSYPTPSSLDDLLEQCNRGTKLDAALIWANRMKSADRKIASNANHMTGNANYPCGATHKYTIKGHHQIWYEYRRNVHKLCPASTLGPPSLPVRTPAILLVILVPKLQVQLHPAALRHLQCGTLKHHSRPMCLLCRFIVYHSAPIASSNHK